ncbi:MAG: hypothetical protein KZQ89_16075 [Candidatus Thiodiazotropha sp. (ex Lucinoma kastoroae)]|nr:hypothetical protein [Candidatus Thiodiazotropha sp. (ex Rostrolucina anterorostrata)]MCU7849471.1 hypothetical protein [Candidatus Thiodiazotropha sp. (ex Lucinoma kastoroae)]
MSKAPLAPVRLAAVGMDQRQRNALRMLFTTQCNNRYVLMEEDSSEICILDLDVFGGERLWEELRERHPDRPLILVSLKPCEIADTHTLFVQKPIPVNQLIAAIEQQRRHLSTRNKTCSQVESATPQPGKKNTLRRAASLMSASKEKIFVGTSPDIDPKDPAQLTKVYYKPDHYLQGFIQQALNQAVRYNKNIAIEGPWPAIILDIEKHRIWVSAEERQLRPYCTVPDATLEVPLRILEVDEASPIGAREFPIQAFLWQLALWASRGRLPHGTDLSQPIYLRRWPNFTRLVMTPYALPIAALWVEQPRSLMDTAETLDIPQRYVFAFYSAAHAIQLAGETRRAVDTLIEPPAVKQSQHRGLFGRLLNRLRGG